MVCVVTKTFGEKTVRQKSLAVDVEEMVSELSEAEKSCRSTEVLSRRSGEQSPRSGDVITIGIMSSCSMMTTVWSYSTKL